MYRYLLQLHRIHRQSWRIEGCWLKSNNITTRLLLVKIITHTHSTHTKYLSLSRMLWPTVSWPVLSWNKVPHPSGAYNQIFIAVWQLRVCWYEVFSLRRGRVCRLLLLLALTNADILGSESLGTRDHILLSQIWDFPFRHLLWLAGLLTKYKKSKSHIATDGQSVSLGVEPHLGLMTRFTLTVMVLFFWATLSDERMVLSFVYAAGPRRCSLSQVRVPWTHDHILLSQIWDFHFCHLLWLAGSRWRYLNPPPHEWLLNICRYIFLYNLSPRKYITICIVVCFT
jgi:hypothetical protein